MLKQIISTWYFWNFSTSEQCSGRCVEECDSNWIRSAGNFDIWYWWYWLIRFVIFIWYWYGLILCHNMDLFIFFRYADKCYKLSKTKKSWWDGEKSCRWYYQVAIINHITFFCWVKVLPDSKEATLPQWGARASIIFWLISKPGCSQAEGPHHFSL